MRVHRDRASAALLVRHRRNRRERHPARNGGGEDPAQRAGKCGHLLRRAALHRTFRNDLGISADGLLEAQQPGDRLFVDAFRHHSESGSAACAALSAAQETAVQWRRREVNRSILIVMCDFLVSAMLTMLAGMSSQWAPGATVGKGAILDRGSTALILEELHRRSAELEAMREKLRQTQAREGFSKEREAELKALAEQLAETMTRAELIERKLELHPENTGALTPEQLQKALEQEIRKRTLAGVQRKEAEAELARMRNSLQSVSGNLAVLNTNFAVSQQQLTDTRKTLEEREAELKQTGGELMKTREELAARQNELAGVRASLEAEQANLSRTRREARTLESDLSFAKGQLSAAERDLALVRGQAERSRKLAEQRETEMREAQRQLADAKNMLKNAVTELSRTRAELNQSREQIARAAEEKAETERILAEKQGQADTARAQLEAAQRELRAAEEKLRSDVLERYDAAVVRLSLALSERRLLLNQKSGGVYYLPLIKVAGKPSCRDSTNSSSAMKSTH